MSESDNRYRRQQRTGNGYRFYVFVDEASRLLVVRINRLGWRRCRHAAFVVPADDDITIVKACAVTCASTCVRWKSNR